jgi:hypothetical protein
VTQQERMSAQMRVYFDALDCIRTPTAELLYLDGKTRMSIAWHLARSVGEDAVIKRRPVPARPGQIAGLIDWVPISTPDSDLPDTTSAVGEIPDPDQLVDSLPWHVKTKIQGAFE